MQLPPDARIVLVRSYFLAEQSAQNDPTTRVQLHIEPLDDPGPAPTLDDATLAAAHARHHRLRAGDVARRPGVRRAEPAPVPFVANEPNTVGTPWSFRNTGIAAAGAVDIFYSSGTFDLRPDEALVMEGTMPAVATSPT